MGVPGSTWKPTVGKKWKYKCMLLNGLENFVDPAIVPLCERTDLPPEIKARLFSLDNLPKVGGAKDSMWYTPPSPKSTKSEALSISPSLNPTTKGFNPVNTSKWLSPSKSEAGKTSSSSLDPAAKDFTPTNTPKWVTPTKSDTGNSSSSTLDPTAKAFVLSSPSRVAKVAATVEFAAANGLTASRWAQPALKTSIVKDTKVVQMDPMSPVKARDIPVHLRGYYIAPHLRPAGLKAVPGKPLLPYVEPHQRVGILPEVISNDVEYKTPSTETSAKIHTTDMTPKTLYSTAPSNQILTTSPATALTNNNLPEPEGHVSLLGASSKESTGSKTSKEFGNSKIVSPQASINRSSVLEIPGPTTSPASTSKKNGSDDPKERVPFLASSFEEFTGCKTLEEYRRKTSVPKSKAAPKIPLATTTDVVREYIQLPSDCYSTKLAPDRKAPKLQPKIHKKENVTVEGVRTVPETLTVPPSRDSQTTATEQTEKVKLPDEVKSKLSSAADVLAITTTGQPTNGAVITETGKAMNSQLRALGPAQDALSQEMEAAAKNPFAICANALEDDEVISTSIATEVADRTNYIASYVGDSRGYLANVDESLHYNGNWMPVVCSWEDDRPEFDYGFMPQYIATWSKTVFQVNGKVDTDCDEFKSGLSPLSLLRFEDPVQQPPCYPDFEQSDNRVKQLVQTAEIDSRNFTNRVARRQRLRERQAQAAVKPESFFVDEELIMNASIPKIDIYLRPAEKKDISGITSIYNHYVLNSIITEDQTVVSEKRMASVLKDAQEQGLPFIVAIKGKTPFDDRTNGAEHVLGFAHTDFLNYGHSGSHTGASRFSGIIQFYVEHSEIRKGIGRCLLDRILACSSSTHATKEGYQWIKPNTSDATVYGRQGGAHRFHQLFFHRHIEAKGDHDHEWLKQWLHSKFIIEEVARFKSAARSSNRGTTARMLDLLIFQFEAAPSGGFDITN